MSDSLTDISPEALASGYVLYEEQLAISGDFEDTPKLSAALRAFSTVRQIVRDGEPDRAWAVTRSVLQAAPDDRLQVYAAGILEDLIRTRGKEVVAFVEREAETDERF